MGKKGDLNINKTPNKSWDQKKKDTLGQLPESNEEKALRNSDDAILARAIADLLKRDEPRDGYLN